MSSTLRDVKMCTVHVNNDVKYGNRMNYNDWIDPLLFRLLHLLMIFSI